MIPSLWCCGIDAFGWLTSFTLRLPSRHCDQNDCSDGFVHPCKANWQASNEMDLMIGDSFVIDRFRMVENRNSSGALGLIGVADKK